MATFSKAFVESGEPGSRSDANIRGDAIAAQYTSTLQNLFSDRENYGHDR